LQEQTIGGGVGPNLLVTIPVGNYSVSQIQSVLTTALIAASATSTWSNTYTVIFNSTTGKLQINKTTNTSYSFSFIMGSSGDFGNNSPRLWLGFNGGSSSSSTFVSPNQVLIAPNMINLSGPNYLYVNSYSLGSLCNLYLPAGSDPLPAGGLGPQMAKIPLTVNPGGTLVWQDPDPQKWFDTQNLNNFADADFYITLGNVTSQTPLRFNGNTFSLKLGVLVNSKAKTNVTGGGYSNDRVIKRVKIG
jgi:hypothetical protein